MVNLSENEKRILLKIARLSIKDVLWNSKDLEKYLNTIELTANLKENRGCFVTLNISQKNKYELRGCIGHIEPLKPLYLCVIENSKNAAFNDLRFLPLSKEEFNIIDIEISILSIPVKIDYRNKEDLFDKIIPMKHGVILKQYDRSATFLPQVWEHFKINEKYAKNMFFRELCLKANLYDNCLDNKPEIYVYEAYIFSEKDIK